MLLKLEKHKLRICALILNISCPLKEILPEDKICMMQILNIKKKKKRNGSEENEISLYCFTGVHLMTMVLGMPNIATFFTRSQEQNDYLCN